MRIGTASARRIGAIEFRDMPTTPLACIAAFLRLHGQHVLLDDLLDVVPIPATGASERHMQFLARRLGIQATPIAASEIAAKVRQETFLIRRTSGYAFLLLGRRGPEFWGGLPGRAMSILPLDSGVLDNVTSVHALSHRPPGPALLRRHRPARLALLAGAGWPAASYDQEAVVRLRAILSRQRYVEACPAPLADLTPPSLLASHRSICASLPAYYGRYRTINLRRHATFIDHAHIERAIVLLLECARNSIVTDPGQAIAFAARLFVDFLSIHPFINANRRMATLLAGHWLSTRGMSVNWGAINSAEYYYRTRCAAYGHFLGMERLFRANLCRTRSPA